MDQIPLLQPSCTDAEIELVADVLRSNWWGMGRVCEEFERALATRTGFKHCVTLNSATAALHLALATLEVHRGDEVILPALTFVSDALAVRYVHANPVFCDVRPDTLGLDWADVAAKITPRTAAVIAVDYAGYPAPPPDPLPVQVAVVEDAAHMPFGPHFGDLVCYSFHPIKPLATPDGGCLLTNNDFIDRDARALRWCGIDKSTWQRSGKKYSWDYDIDEVGWKCHMNDVVAAIGLAQLARFDAMWQRRCSIALRYLHELSGVEGLELPCYHEKHLWHLFVIRVAPYLRDRLLDHLAERGISAGCHYKPVSEYRPFRDVTPPVTAREWRRMISLPIFPDMTDEQQARVIDAVGEFFNA